jgi:RNA polymerase sigma factor (sigma-70 family)
MAQTGSSSILRAIRRVVEDRRVRELPDQELLRRFTAHRDEEGFHALVRRHGPMVLDVCRGVLGNEADAEDAFQATFLVLACKAGAIRKGESLASWLHGVAQRTALKARTRRATRHKHEARVTAPPAGEADDLTWREVRQVLHEELGRLSERYRAPLVLCYLEGTRQEEAAAALGLAKSTLRERLERGRAILRARLVSRGLGPAALLLAAASPRAKADAALTASTVQAATAGVVSPAVAALTKGVLTTMMLTKVKTALAVLFVIGIAALGAGAWTARGRAVEPAEEQQPRQANRDDLHDRVAELKQQLRQLEKKLARLEEETQPRTEERGPRDGFPANRFKHRIAFEVGVTESKEGGRIEIQEVWGTRPRIEVGGQYLVRGKYVLPPGERGTLYFYETAEGDWGRNPTANMDLQYTTLDKEKGEFTLLHGMAGPGYFHLVLADPERYSRMFANVHFGTGDNVLRKKSW